MNEITLRKATIDDLDLTFNWRNTEVNRRYCLASSEPIAKETHLNWFNKILHDQNRCLLIAEIDNQPIGVLRYDVVNSEAEISIYLKPGLPGKGYGTLLIDLGTEWLKNNVPQVNRIIANISPENMPSQKAFTKAGFKEHHISFIKNL